MYITAAISYSEWVLSFSDIVTVFVVDLLEYFLFSALGLKPFNPSRIQFRVAIITGLASAAHLYVLARLSTMRAFREPTPVRTVEKLLQLINCLLAFAVCLTSVSIWRKGYSATSRTPLIAAAVETILIFLDVAISVRVSVANAAETSAAFAWLNRRSASKLN